MGKRFSIPIQEADCVTCVTLLFPPGFYSENEAKRKLLVRDTQ